MLVAGQESHLARKHCCCPAPIVTALSSSRSPTQSRYVVGIGIRGEAALPVRAGVVPGRVDPEDPAGERVLGRVLGCARAAAAVAARGARIAQRAADHVGSLGLGEVDARLRVRAGVGARERELRRRGHLVHDLGDLGAVAGRVDVGAEIERGQPRGQVPLGDARGVPGEPDVHDGDLDARPVEPRLMRERGLGERHPLAGDRVGHQRQRRPQVGDGPLAAELGQASTGTAASIARPVPPTTAPPASATARAPCCGASGRNQAPRRRPCRPAGGAGGHRRPRPPARDRPAPGPPGRCPCPRRSRADPRARAGPSRGSLSGGERRGRQEARYVVTISASRSACPRIPPQPGARVALAAALNPRPAAAAPRA